MEFLENSKDNNSEIEALALGFDTGLVFVEGGVLTGFALPIANILEVEEVLEVIGVSFGL